VYLNGVIHLRIQKKFHLQVKTKTTSQSLFENIDKNFLLVNCWPNETANGGCDVNIEYELQNTNLILKDVQISVPLP